MLFSPETLLTATILKEIEQDNRQYLYKLEIFDKISSTNTFLLERAKENVPSGMVCLAEDQTHGRGRHQKKWLSSPGANINSSLLWRFKNETPVRSGLSLAIGVMVANALHKYGIRSGIQLKWPNDVLYAEKKLGGILLESNQPHSVVIGIGLNLYLSPEKNELTHATSIFDIVREPPKRNYLIGLLLNELLSQLPVFEKMGLHAFMQQWQTLDALIGKEVTIHTENQVIGQVLGINDRGELLLRDRAGVTQHFNCGEVSVRVNS